MRVVTVAALMAALLIVADCGLARIAGEASHIQGQSRTARPSSNWPPVILWAWERPNDLTFVDPRRVGVSYLVETIRLSRGGIDVQPNLNGLMVPAGTWLMACARIETETARDPAFSPQQFNQLVRQLASLAKFPDARAVQIDFDATVSQREFYRKLLAELRRSLPESVPLSITALTSWCIGDDWISQLPVSEAVPMLFRMGRDRASILLRLAAGGDFQEPLCRQSTGISTDEFFPRLTKGRRLYIFNPNGWTKASFEKIIAKSN